MAKQERKLDIFRVLSHINKKDIHFYSSLTDEEQKGFAPLVVQRWLSGTKDPGQIIFLNELVNPFIFNIQKHKELLYQLMTICTRGQFTKYNYPKQKSKKSSLMPTTLSVVKRWFNYSSADAYEVLPLLSDDDILIQANELGLQKEEIAKIKRELKTR